MPKALIGPIIIDSLAQFKLDTNLIALQSFLIDCGFHPQTPPPPHACGWNWLFQSPCPKQQIFQHQEVQEHPVAHEAHQHDQCCNHGVHKVVIRRRNDSQQDP